MEKYTVEKPVVQVGETCSSYRCLRDDDIRHFGTDIEAAEGIIKAIFQRKFQKEVSPPFELWDRVIALRLTRRLESAVGGESFSLTQTSTLADIATELREKTPDWHKQDILHLLALMDEDRDLGQPLYVSAKVLNSLGAHALDKAIDMMGGTRRIMPSA